MHGHFVRIPIAGDHFDGDVTVRDHADRAIVAVHHYETADVFAAHLGRTFRNVLFIGDGRDLVDGHVDDFHGAGSHSFKSPF